MSDQPSLFDFARFIPEHIRNAPPAPPPEAPPKQPRRPRPPPVRRQMMTAPVEAPSLRPPPAHVQVFEPDEDISADLVFRGATGQRLIALVHELKCIDRFVDAGVDPPTRWLFAGPSGVGKTLFVRWLGFALEQQVGVLDISRCVASHLGETAKNIAEAFAWAKGAQAILFMDEVDAAVANRSSARDGCDKELARATTTMLQQLDWLPPTTIVIAATNLPERLDDAFARRLRDRINFELPDAAARKAMVDRWLARAPVSEEQRERIVAGTEGMSGADVRAEAMRVAREEIVRGLP